MKTIKNNNFLDQDGKVGYFILWLMGAPVGVLILLYLLLGSNIFSPG